MTTSTTGRRQRIPTWISVFQVLLIVIMLGQVYQYYFDHDAVRAAGMTVETIADQRFVYEFAARTLTMAVVSAVIVFWQRVELFIVMFIMNLLREGQETIIDPLFPSADIPGFPPILDLAMHLVIVAVQAFALYQLYRVWRATRAEGADSTDKKGDLEPA